MNMKTRLHSFNIYLLAAVALLGGGCASHHLSANKQYATLRVYLEGRAGESSRVQVTRNKILMYVAAEPFVTEADVRQAKLVDYPDGSFSILVTFDDHGTLMLDMNTSSHSGQHLLIFCHFPPKGWKEPKEGDSATVEKPVPGQPRISGWLAAPLIRYALPNGSLEFTPDASHQEAEQIVLGLNNMAAALSKMRH